MNIQIFRIYSVLFTLVFLLNGAFAQKKDNKKPEDEGTKLNRINKYLQIDSINIPKDLDEIDFEIRQNTIDVVLNSPKYIFLTSKRDKIVNKNYKDYNSLKVELKRTNSKTYVAKIHLENWYSAKYDRKFSSSLSKYNLLTDLRMGIYELLYGRVFVRKNREKLIQYSAIRIKKIKELARQRALEGGAKGDKKDVKKKNTPDEELIKEERQSKKKDKKDALGGDSDSDSKAASNKKDKSQDGDENANKENEKPKEVAGDPNSEDPKRNKKNKSKVPLEKDETEDITQVDQPEVPPKKNEDPRIQLAKEAEEIDDEKVDDKINNLFSSQDLFDTPPNFFINKKSILSAKLLYTNYTTESTNYLLNTTLDMTFLRFGANVKIIEERLNPFEYNFLLLAGSSIANEVTQIPAWRTIDINANKYMFVNTLKLGVGLESSPYFFINLPIAGEGQNLYELDILYVKGIAELHLNLFRREVIFGGSYGQSISVSSTIENYESTVAKLELYARTYFTKKYGIEFSSEGYNISGTDQGQPASSTGTNYSLNLLTKFN